MNEQDRRGVNGHAKKVARPVSSSTLTAAPRSAILLGGSCLRPLRGQSSLQLADAPVLFGDDLDQGRDECDRQNRRLLAAALERIPTTARSPARTLRIGRDGYGGGGNALFVGLRGRSGGYTEAVVEEDVRRIAGAASLNQLT